MASLSVVRSADAKVLVTADINSVPLSDALRDLSSHLPVELTVSRDIADQRVTFCVTNQTLPQFMASVVKTLSHTSGNTKFYFWETEPPNGSAGKTYRLKQASAGRVAERRELEKPIQEALQSLYDLRNAARLGEIAAKKVSPTEHKKRSLHTVWIGTFKPLRG